MSPPAELSYDEILKFMLAHNGKVTNHELVKHFKVFLMNPDMRGKYIHVTFIFLLGCFFHYQLLLIAQIFCR